MEPTLKNGSAVLVSGIPFLFSKPSIGDIVAFKRNDKVIIKRIKKRVNDKYYLIGDNQRDSLDSKKFGWILVKDILGKVVLTLIK